MTLAVTAALALAGPGAAPASMLQPGPGKVFFGLTDSGVTSQFTEFTEVVGKHPAVIETFRTWGADLVASIRRWQNALARPMLHITTADSTGLDQVITLRGIALGKGDDYLIGSTSSSVARNAGLCPAPRGAEPLPQPLRVLRCTARSRLPTTPYWYKQAFRRAYMVLHGGGKLATNDKRLAAAGCRR